MKARYAALYRTGRRGGNYFKFMYLDYPDELMPPPIIRMGKPMEGIHEFVWADDQHSLALAYDTSQQNISRWLKNTAPKLINKELK